MRSIKKLKNLVVSKKASFFRYKNAILISLLLVVGISFVAGITFINKAKQSQAKASYTVEVAALPVNENYFESGFITPASCGVASEYTYPCGYMGDDTCIGYASPFSDYGHTEWGDACSQPAPPSAPTGLNASCNGAGTQVTLSWNAPAGATHYLPRITILAGQSCPAGWLAYGATTCYINDYVPTSVNFGSIPNQNYGWWVYSADNITTPTNYTSSNFTCAVPPVTTFTSAATGNGVSYNTATTLSWSSTNSATGCTATGGTFAGAKAATGGPVSTGALTSNTTYTLFCSNAGGNSSTITRILTVCTAGTPVWNGSACVAPTGFLNVSSTTCEINTGTSTCSINATWGTTNPYGTSAITTPVNQTLYTGNSGGPSPVVVTGTGPTNFYLYNNGGAPLDQKTVTPTCAEGGWESGRCVNPKVVSAVILGQNYPPGSLRLTCNADTTTYSITKDTVPTTVVAALTAYNGPVVINTITQGTNYTILCTNGSVSGPQVVRGYDPVPSPTTINFVVNVTTVTNPPTSVPLSWSIAYPNNTCTLTGKIVCPNNACSAVQNTAQTALNTALTGSTDLNDPNTSRSMVTAIQTPAPGHKDTDVPLINADFKALGKKTLRITNTTDFTLTCNGNSVTKRVRVTKSEEQ